MGIVNLAEILKPTNRIPERRIGKKAINANKFILNIFSKTKKKIKIISPNLTI